MAKKLGKRARSLIALGAAAAVLAAAFLLVKLLPGEDEETPGSEAEDIFLYDCEKETIAGFTLASAEESWTVEVQRTEEETVYTLAGYPDVPVNATKAGDVLTNISKLKAASVVEAETPADLALYGLDPPVVTATARFADGSSMEFYLGYKTGAGSYYMMKQGDPAVYEVKSIYGKRFSYGMGDLVNTDVMPAVDMNTLNRLVLRRADQPEIEASHYEIPKDQPRLGVSSFRIIKPFALPRDVDGQEFDAFLGDIDAIKVSGIVSLDPGQKAEYGLDSPRMELIIGDDEGTHTVYFGDDYGEDQVACMVEGYVPIYAVDRSSIEFLEQAKAENLADKFLLLPMIDDVDRVDISIGGRSYSLTIRRTTEKAAEEGKEDKVIETYFLDGVQKDEDPFKDVYQAAIGVTADAYATDPALAEGETVATVTYYFNVGDIPSMTVSYHAYDVDFYAGALDGETCALVAKRKVDKIATALDALAESKYTGE